MKSNVANLEVSVERLLNEVNYDFEGYIPSEDAFEYFTFMRLVLGEEPENMNPLAHYFLIDTLFRKDNVREFYESRGMEYEDNPYTAIMCHREFSKSVLIGTFMPLYMAWKGALPGFGRISYGIYVGDSMENNVKTTMQTIEAVYEDSVFLRDFFEEARFTDRKVYFLRKDISKKGNTPKKRRFFAMNGYGAQTGLRGGRQALDRPQFAIMDDLIKSEADANSETVLKNIQSTIDSDVLNALHGGSSFAWFVGTPYNKKDPLYKAIESGEWASVVFPVCEEINIDLAEKDFKGSWEDRHSYKNVMRRYRKALNPRKPEDGSLRSFMQEMMLRISSEEERLIKDDDITWFSRGDVLKNYQDYNWYITTDFTSTGNKGSDYSAIGVWAVNSNQDYMLVDLVVKRMDLEEQYATVFKLVSTYSKGYNNIEVGVEVDGGQRTHIYSLKQLMPRNKTYFTIARQKGKKQEGITSKVIKGNKHDRFKLTTPLFQTKKIWFANELKGTPSMNEMIEELTYVTYFGFGAKHDDACDIVSQLILMNIRFPSESRTVDKETKKHKSKVWDDVDDDDEVKVSSCIF